MAPVTMSHDSQEPFVNDGDQIGRLLKLAGHRQMPDPADMRRAREAARTEWTGVVRRRAWRGRWRLGLGAMAAALCGIAAWVSLRTPAPAVPADVATFHRVMGTVVVTSVEGRRTVTGPGIRLEPGARLEIANDSRAALVLIDGTTISFDRATVAVFANTHHVTLERGAAYIDSGGAAGAESALRIETAFGAVRHLGTQFEVRVAAASMRVRVREGLVAVERGAAKWTTGVGEALVVAASGPPSRERIATTGPEWRWIHELSQPFILEGSTLQAFLDWIGREQGWRWEIADATLRARADRVVLHGSIEGLTPEEALSAVLPAAGLTWRREGTRLVIEAVRRRSR
jgi:hypothetical protein